jgi:molecular chaperone DnaK
VLLLDVTPLSLGIETLGGVMTKLIEKNTTIPTKKSEVFSTAEDNQTAVTIHVLQGEREMAADNKHLGRFELVGIPPAPRGMPQIEVTFDIDANGIVEVSARDQATGKAQSIRITHSSGLSQSEIDQLIRDAEAHSESDKRKRGLVEARNEADATVYATEKSLADIGERIDGNTRSEVEQALAGVKDALKSDDEDEIKRSTEKLRHAAHAMAQTAYGRKTDAGSGPDTANRSASRGNAQSAGTGDDDVVDADFEEVN